MNHAVIVTVNSDGSYDYNHNGMHACKHHVQDGDQIRWKSNQGDITVSFNKNGNPTTGSATYTAPKGQSTTPATLSGNPGDTFDYTVGVHGYDDDDPQIIFDDGGIPSNVLEEEIAPDEFGLEEKFAADPAPTIKTVMSDLLDQLQSRAEGDKFFPFGITNIQVNVTAGGITFGVTVSGPNTKP